MARVPLVDLQDKIRGAWAGQMIGVSFAAPTEFRYCGRTIPEGELPVWSPEHVRNSLDQDDLYVEMTFAKVLDDKGLDATTEDFSAVFRDSRYALWHANLAARRALRRGVPASLSGTPRYNVHANDIDFQIESDFIGIMTPGMPQAATEMAWRIGRVMNYGDGIYGGIFVACMYAAAFFERSPRRIVEAGLACLPPQSSYARVISDVLEWSKQSPEDWLAVWKRLEDKWNIRKACPAGALHPFNIDAKFNGAYVAIGLLYGRGDFGQTVRISTRCGQDSDCNASTAAGVLGASLGYEKIPSQWKSGIAAIAKQKFRYTDFSFESIVESTAKRVVAVATSHGGRLEDDVLVVRKQRPKPTKLEVWDDFGTPVERIRVQDTRWSWKGAWKAASVRPHRTLSASERRSAAEKGAEAEIRFQGTGAILVGPLLPNGGRADIYLDGRFDKTVDAYSDEEQPKQSEGLWHAFGLKAAVHTVRVVVRGEPQPGSKGADFAIDDLIVFRQADKR